MAFHVLRTSWECSKMLGSPMVKLVKHDENPRDTYLSYCTVPFNTVPRRSIPDHVQSIPIPIPMPIPIPIPYHTIPYRYITSHRITLCMCMYVYIIVYIYNVGMQWYIQYIRTYVRYVRLRYLHYITFTFTFTFTLHTYWIILYHMIHTYHIFIIHIIWYTICYFQYSPSL